MRDKNGFTLVELLATIIVLALLMSIAGFSVAQVIKSSKEENYKLLVSNIKSAAELYYQECRYSKSSSVCSGYNGRITLGKLVNYGFLKGNAKGNDNDKDTNYNLLSNPMDTNDITNCEIIISYSDGKVIVSAVSGSDNNNGSCPSYN